jgi:glycosyltransferase involved in cell wall biosynthesis
VAAPGVRVAHVDQRLRVPTVEQQEARGVGRGLLHGALASPAHVEPLTQTLERLLGDASLATRAGERGRAAALTHFSPRAMAQAYERVYEDLLACR